MARPEVTTASARARRAGEGSGALRGRGRGRGRGHEQAPHVDDPAHAVQAAHADEDVAHDSGLDDEQQDVGPAHDDPQLQSYPGGPHTTSLLTSYHQHEMRYVWDHQVCSFNFI